MNPALHLSEEILLAASNLNASDIHFYPFYSETKIYCRINGKRIFFRAISNEKYQLLLTHFKFTSGMDIGETRKPQNGSRTFKTALQSYSIRLSTLPVKHSESLAIRLIPLSQSSTLEKLLLFPSQVKTLKKWIANRAGILLLSGPTGSGKTTTLYALLQKIITEQPYQTITLEDPIEKNLDGIIQVQINERAGITYQAGLKAALRHDPDIIMVGEIRDHFTAQFAFEASLTGHLVLSTVHAKDTVGTINRLKDLGIQTTDLKQSLLGVASIQLIPITMHGKQNIRRAAILEILDGKRLISVLQGKTSQIHDYTSFYHLRKKAYAYGYFLDETEQG